jgi:hypothetical protein
VSFLAARLNGTANSQNDRPSGGCQLNQFGTRPIIAFAQAL